MSSCSNQQGLPRTFPTCSSARSTGRAHTPPRTLHPSLPPYRGQHAARWHSSADPLRAGFLFFLAVEGAQAAAGNLHDLESHTRDVADGVAAAAEARDEHLVVLVDEVQATVPRHESRDLLAVLDELDAAALADGRVRLLRFDADLLDDDTLCVRGAAEGIALVLGAQVGLLVVLVGPPLLAAADDHLTGSTDTTGLVAAAHLADCSDAVSVTRA
mmetsp:Transcript_8054/g.22340  ORF Transcript_8054/g.22340 Transcript_8054/m.22340 type:complete len:215 (-) Transcript_8054:39-683(-)